MSECSDANYQILSILRPCCVGAGVVQLAKCKRTGKTVVIKRINLDKSKESVDAIEAEVIRVRELSHPNIVKYAASYVSSLSVCIVSPLMGYGSCRDLLNVHFLDGLQEGAILFITHAVLSALAYIHRCGIIHRAIRASHVLIGESGNVCLAGFRYSCPIVKNGRWQRKIHSFPSTPRNLNWLSPELLEQNLEGYNELSDLYSVGLLMTELANGTEPFGDMSTTLMLTEKVRGCAPQLIDCTTMPPEQLADPSMNPQFDAHSNRRFNNCLHEIAGFCLKDAHCRPTAAQLLTHPYFKYALRGTDLRELLKPAIPIGDNVVIDNADEFQYIDNIQKLGDMDLYSYEWDF